MPNCGAAHQNEYILSREYIKLNVPSHKKVRTIKIIITISYRLKIIKIMSVSFLQKNFKFLESNWVFLSLLLTNVMGSRM